MWNHIKLFVSALIFALTLPMPAPAQAQSDEERDFVPGEKAVFYDDYTDMAKGAAPPHWKKFAAVLPSSILQVAWS